MVVLKIKRKKKLLSNTLPKQVEGFTEITTASISGISSILQGGATPKHERGQYTQKRHLRVKRLGPIH